MSLADSGYYLSLLTILLNSFNTNSLLFSEMSLKIILVRREMVVATLELSTPPDKGINNPVAPHLLR